MCCDGRCGSPDQTQPPIKQSPAQAELQTGRPGLGSFLKVNASLFALGPAAAGLLAPPVPKLHPSLSAHTHSPCEDHPRPSSGRIPRAPSLQGLLSGLQGADVEPL